MDIIEDLEQYAAEKQISFAEAMAKYDVVSAEHDPVHGSFIVMAERNPINPSLAMRELGYASPSPWTAWTRDERVPELRDKTGLRTYYDMKRADGTVRGALRAFKTPMLAARWYIEANSESPIDQNIANFVEKNFFEELSVPWSRVVEDALLMCEYGFMPFELVFREDYSSGRYRLKLQKLSPLHPMDIRDWIWDGHGGISGLVMENFYLDAYGITDNQGSTNNDDAIDLPIQKLVIFVFEEEAGDLRGISLLRSAYKHYFFKDCVDEETEIFTQRGWLKFHEIRDGDKTLSINESTGLGEWDEIQYIKEYTGTHDMIRMESSQFSALTTPDHRWLTKFKGEYRWRTTETLTHDDNLPRIAPCVNLPTESKYTDEFVELMAWIWTEGNLLNDGFIVSQSIKVNYQNVLRIRRALFSMCPNPVKGCRFNNGHKYWNESIDEELNMTKFYIGVELAKEFKKEFISHKIISPDFITSLTEAQLRLFVEVSLLGDGYLNPKSGGPIVTQENEEQLIALQMACSLLGIPTSLKKYSVKGYSDRWLLNLQKSIFINPRKSASLAKARGYKDGMKITKEEYNGTIWCPRTSNGNWLARRNGVVFTTGNSLYKIDAIQKERHGIGIPIIKLPLGFSNSDKMLAEDLGRNLRTNERAHIVVPANWEIGFAKLEGQPVDCMTSISHHDMKIKSNILAPFMDEPNPGAGTGGYDLFYKSVRYVANTVCDSFNHFVIPKLVDANFSRGGYPKLRVRHIGEWEDIRTQSFAYRNFVGAGTIRPDDRLEEFVRNMLDLPPMDRETTRIVDTPQANTPTSPSVPPVGPPRQGPPSAGAPRTNAGIDTSGGE